ncbi:hypothetical protein E4U23_001718 [Claviceps purpurea]|nr:hypothetical protein E4U23_001706 [Claviceps purpurea]KAG6250042.1 hypothetical protein E4U23_001718 [Claviceps purpurea]
MAAPVTDPAIAPAERVPLSDSFDDDELVNVDVGVHVEHGAGVVAALSDAVFPATDDGDSVERGASETATVCLVTVTTELFGIVCFTPESAFLAGEGEGAGRGNEDEDEEEASGDAIVLVRVPAVEVVSGLRVQYHSHHHPDSSGRSLLLHTTAEDLAEPLKQINN